MKYTQIHNPVLQGRGFQSFEKSRQPQSEDDLISKAQTFV